jgi:diadenosine tetraphosphate (Ap4A) HIT family hydrolase
MTDLEIAHQQDIAPWDDRVEEFSDFHVVAFRDRYPVTPGHLLFVPQYNTDAVIIDCFKSAMFHGRRMVENKECDAFNIGINMGREAGQTVMYPHVHLIPRRAGDMLDPRGGVRHVIPEKGNYKKNES